MSPLSISSQTLLTVFLCRCNGKMYHSHCALKLCSAMESNNERGTTDNSCCPATIKDEFQLKNISLANCDKKYFLYMKVSLFDDSFICVARELIFSVYCSATLWVTRSSTQGWAVRREAPKKQRKLKKDQGQDSNLRLVNYRPSALLLSCWSSGLVILRTQV